jgi:hypothetical protein
VPVSPVADQVDHDVALPLLPVGHRETDRRNARLDVVGVHVDDRHVVALRHVGRVRRRARLLRVGREPHLIVGDDVDRAACGVPLERQQVERLGNHALGGERRVAVQQQRDHAAGIVKQLCAGMG